MPRGSRREKSAALGSHAIQSRHSIMRSPSGHHSNCFDVSEKVKTFTLNAAAMVLALLPCSITAAPAFAQSMQAGSLESYYRGRSMPIWFDGGVPTAAANALPGILRRAPLDGLADGPRLATQVQLAIDKEQRDPNSSMEMDQLLSSVWVTYVQALEAPVPQFEYASAWMAPPTVQTTSQILDQVASHQSMLLQHVLKTASVNPIYNALREEVWKDSLRSSIAPSAAALANLARVRMIRAEGRYVVVDLRAAELYMFDGAQLIDSMRVIVGAPKTPTPLLVSTIYRVTFNPYWNVPPDLVQRLIAPRVLAQGITYLTSRHYEVVTNYDATASEVPPSTVDWKGVADGTVQAHVRELPGNANSMGTMKFSFFNSKDIYLHDTPSKALFKEKSRFLSNGCIRLEDARRFGRWLLSREPQTSATSPDAHEILSQPVPIYITYLTPRADEQTRNVASHSQGDHPSDDQGPSTAH